MNSQSNNHFGDSDFGALIAYLDGDLSPEARAAVEARLAREPQFRAELAALREVTGALGALGDRRRAETPEVDLLESVLNRARQEDSLEDLQALEQDLFSLGDSRRQAAPEVDLLAGVLDRVRQADAAPLEIADEEALIAQIDAAYAESHPDRIAELQLPVSLQQDAQVYRRMIDDLHLLGAEYAAAAPQIDITDAVLARVHDLRALKNVTPLRRGPKPAVPSSPRGARHWWRVAVPLAAAACLTLLMWPVVQGFFRSNNDAIQVAQGPPAQDIAPDTGNGSTAFDEVPAAGGDRPDVLKDPEPERDRHRTRRKSLTAQDVRAELLNEDLHQDRLQLLAALTEDQVRDMIANNDLDLEALLGAIQFLPRDEAIAVLLEQLQRSPEDPYLRYALANEMGNDPAARAQLAAWGELDPNNALPYYMDARILLEQGDLEGALALLQQAAQLEQAYPYSLLSAQYHEEALLAAGYDTDAARLLAATTGGADEYNDLRSLADQLLQHGQYYESIGEFDTAQALYDAVHDFGLQLDEGAMFTDERLAALETQQDALGSLQNLYDVLGNEQNVQVMLESLQLLTLGLSELAEVFTQQNQLFANEDLNTILTIAGTILLSGDLNLF